MRWLLSLALVVAATGTAAADGLFFTESFGGTGAKDEVSAYMSGAFRIRISGGYRMQHVALEAWMAGDLNTDVNVCNYSTPPQQGSGYEITTPRIAPGATGGGYSGGYGGCRSTSFASWGLDAKYIQPLSPNLEAYVRGGLSRGYAEGIHAEGPGLGVGAGVQLKGKVPVIGFLFWPLFFTGLGPKVTAAVFVDATSEFYRLHGDGFSTDAQFSHLTLGFAVGNDF